MGAVSAAADVFRAVADPTRRALLDLLHDHDRSVSELAASFRISQPAISQHLRILRSVGLVKSRRVGRSQLYHLNATPLRQIYGWASQYQDGWGTEVRPLFWSAGA